MKVRTLGPSSNALLQWCEPIGWEPKNLVEGQPFLEGGWWDDHEQIAGLALFGPSLAGDESDEKAENLLVVSCGEAKIIECVLV